MSGSNVLNAVIIAEADIILRVKALSEDVIKNTGISEVSV